MIPTLKLYIDINSPYGQTLLSSATNSAQLHTRPTLFTGDTFPIHLSFLTRAADYTAAPDPVTLDPTDILTLSIRPSTGTSFIAADDFSFDAPSGTWQAVCAIPDTLDTSSPIIAEIEISNAAKTQRITKQFEIDILPQIHSESGIVEPETGGGGPGPLSPPRFIPSPSPIYPESGKAYMLTGGTSPLRIYPPPSPEPGDYFWFFVGDNLLWGDPVYFQAKLLGRAPGFNLSDFVRDFRVCLFVYINEEWGWGSSYLQMLTPPGGGGGSSGGGLGEP